MIRPTSDQRSTRGLTLKRALVAGLTCVALAPTALGENGTYTVQSGETVASIARRLKLTEEHLRDLNHLPAKSLVKEGQKLAIPEQIASPIPAPSAAGATVAKSAGSSADSVVSGVDAATSTTVYQVQAGDSLTRIALIHRMSPEALATANQLKVDAILQIGQKLTVPTPGKPASMAASAPTATAAPEPKPAAVAVAAPKPVQPEPRAAEAHAKPEKAAPSKPAQPVAVQVGEGRVKLRSSASMEAGVVSSVDPGSRLTIVGKDGQWWKVAVPGTKQVAYVAGWVVQPILAGQAPSEVKVATKPTPTPANEPRETVDAKSSGSLASIAGDRVNLRSGPSAESTKLSVLDGGTTFSILDKDGEWVKVKAGDSVGWVSKSLTSLGEPHADSSSSKGEKILRLAMTYLGAPYVRGGTSHDGVDCSGLTYAVARELGINLPRTSSDQWGVGKAVDKGNLKPGDLVFFKNTYRDGISHVGVYAGGGRFVHAVRSGKPVSISSLDDGYYVAHWAGAYRVTE
ncbi:MAG: C40 family peptidase [Armatimonadetes bacterium]|nr:C40 family peptidase [Armatimonadota bacterium]